MIEPGHIIHVPSSCGASVAIANHLPMMLFAGPCQMESRDHALEMAHALHELCQRLSIPLIFKTSFDKANRTSLSGKRGIGIEKSMAVFEEIRARYCPVITDVHNEGQCAEISSVVDVLQIPAFLCRQTDLLLAAGLTGKPVKVKKGQFLSPWNVQPIVDKIKSTGNDNVLLTERGSSFGYGDLVVDMRSLPVMCRTGQPVIFDATHSVQQPGGRGDSSGGLREFVSPLARAAIAIGVAGLFIETHEDPDNAPSDGPNMVPLPQMEGLLTQLKALDDLTKQQLRA